MQSYWRSKKASLCSSKALTLNNLQVIYKGPILIMVILFTTNLITRHLVKQTWGRTVQELGLESLKSRRWYRRLCYLCYFIVCTPLSAGEESLTGPQLLEEGCWERGGDFFQWGEEGGGGWGVLQFSQKK